MKHITVDLLLGGIPLKGTVVIEEQTATTIKQEPLIQTEPEIEVRYNAYNQKLASDKQVYRLKQLGIPEKECLEMTADDAWKIINSKVKQEKPYVNGNGETLPWEKKKRGRPRKSFMAS